MKQIFSELIGRFSKHENRTLAELYIYCGAELIRSFFFLRNSIRILYESVKQVALPAGCGFRLELWKSRFTSLMVLALSFVGFQRLLLQGAVPIPWRAAVAEFLQKRACQRISLSNFG